MRTALAFLGLVLTVFVLLLGGGALVFVGFLEWSETSGKRSVEFASPGDDCDAARLELNIEDGTRLTCTTGVPVPSSAFRGLEGFSAAQNSEVLTLAADLGEDGLSEAEQQRIEDRVDEIAATLPPLEDERILPGPTGINRILLGVAMLVGLGIWYLVIGSRQRRYP
ncbi:hypothetical protein [Actinophytocola gossypii]|uniref:Uncharacterized protein n=1 Tax=Actinophytocola gossypii TaxID=2812003 RepID=A0ABT2JL01_9PSEU|nr:hypothetical protein [Actinophytocola gossypii]MCT2588070.1 hypothetical protein [Actinophytocola gossypii]